MLAGVQKSEYNSDFYSPAGKTGGTVGNSSARGIEKTFSPKSKFTEIIGESASLQRLLQLIEAVAPTDATVLILGARAAHTSR
jgi:transcriptional regulator with AAA-type ATPase domain